MVFPYPEGYELSGIMVRVVTQELAQVLYCQSTLAFYGRGISEKLRVQ